MSKQVPDLPNAGALTGAEKLHVVQDGNSRQTTIAAILAAVIDAAPGTLDTLNELAAALGDDPNYAATIAGQIAALTASLGAKANTADVPELARDAIGAALVALGLAVTVNDGADTITFSAKRTCAGFFTSALGASEIFAMWTPPAGETVTFADEFAGAYGKTSNAPDVSAFVIDVLKNGGVVGTISIATTGVMTFTTTGAAVSYIGGTDYLELRGPAAADATCSNVCVTLIGTVS